MLAAGTPSGARADPPESQACIQSHYDGQVAQREGRLLVAREAFTRCSVPDCPAVIREDCGSLQREVSQKIPSVVLAARSARGDEPGVKVSMDGVPIVAMPEGKALELESGRHVFRFEHPDFAPVEMTVIILAGDRNRAIVAELAPRASAEVPAPVLHRSTRTLEEPGPVLWPTYLVGGVALVGLGIFIGFGAKGVSDRSELLGDTGCAPFCSDEELSGPRRDFLIADVGLGVALAATTATILLVALRPTKKSTVTVTSAGFAPAWSQGALAGAALEMGGAF
jgi:hypothetical protein